MRGLVGSDRGRVARAALRAAWLVCLVVAWLPRAVEAQWDGTPSQDPAGFVGFASTRAPGPWLLDSSLAFAYALEPLRVPAPSASPTATQAVRHRVTVDMARLRVGLGGRGALRIAVPVVAATRGADARPGLADGELAAQLRVWGASTDALGDTPEGAGAQLELATSLPWGSDATLAASPRPRLQGALTADMHAFGVVAGARAAYAHHLSVPPSGLGRDRLELTLGVQVPALLFGRLRPEQLTEHVLLDLAIQTEPQHLFARQRTSIEARAALRFRVGEWLVSSGVSAGLMRTRETAAVQVFLALGNSPRPRDADRDGVLDGRDDCPQLTEDLDGFEDADGCPEPDNDGDGILDEDDRCPLEPSDWDRDANEDGCNDS